MRTRRTKEESKEGTKAHGPQRFAEMCRRMMSGEMPDCCGPQMREMMSRWMAESRAGEEKQPQPPSAKG